MLNQAGSPGTAPVHRLGELELAKIPMNFGIDLDLASFSCLGCILLCAKLFFKIFFIQFLNSSE